MKKTAFRKKMKFLSWWYLKNNNNNKATESHIVLTGNPMERTNTILYPSVLFLWTIPYEEYQADFSRCAETTAGPVLPVDVNHTGTAWQLTKIVSVRNDEKALRIRGDGCTIAVNLTTGYPNIAKMVNLSCSLNIHIQSPIMTLMDFRNSVFIVIHIGPKK